MRLTRAFDKSVIASFPSHDVQTKDNRQDASAANGHAQSQLHYRMPMNSYSGQPHLRHSYGRNQRPCARLNNPGLSPDGLAQRWLA
jgi:alpha-beta hydrolase superfamily lysophospholipase